MNNSNNAASALAILHLLIYVMPFSPMTKIPVHIIGRCHRIGSLQKTYLLHLPCAFTSALLLPDNTSLATFSAISMVSFVMAWYSKRP